MAKFKNKYRIESSRLQKWDYGSNGIYFITICKKNRELFFGNIKNNNIELSNIGQLANQFWTEIPKHFKNIELGEFIIMPNHIHGIIINHPIQTRQCHISTEDNKNNITTKPTHGLGSKENNKNKTIGQKRFQNQGKNTISSIIGSFKSVTTKHARKINPKFAWQPLFWDSIIRDEKGLKNVTYYIKNNPKKWAKDEHNL
jgi:REP element-mobilizing transposase RayT